MAGSGKTTLVNKLKNQIQDSFIVNLDPAVYELPYSVQIDIRQAVDYDKLISDR